MMGDWAKLFNPSVAGEMKAAKKPATGASPATLPKLSKVEAAMKADERKALQMEKLKAKAEKTGAELAAQPKKDISKAERIALKEKAAQEAKEKAAEKEKAKAEKEQKKAEKEAQPKGPQTAYFIFAGDVREQTKADNPGMALADLSKIIGAAWKALTDEQKTEYEEKVRRTVRERCALVPDVVACGPPGGVAATCACARLSRPRRLCGGAGRRCSTASGTLRSARRPALSRSGPRRRSQRRRRRRARARSARAAPRGRTASRRARTRRRTATARRRWRPRRRHRRWRQRRRCAACPSRARAAPAKGP